MTLPAPTNSQASWTTVPWPRMRRRFPPRLVPLAALLLLAGCSTPDAGTSSGPTRQGETVVGQVGDVVGHYTIDQIHADRLEGFYQVPYPVATSGPGSP